MSDLHEKLKPSHMEDLLMEFLLLENCRSSFLMEIRLVISCNAKDPWFSYLEKQRAKKPNMLESTLMGKVNLLGK